MDSSSLSTSGSGISLADSGVNPSSLSASGSGLPLADSVSLRTSGSGVLLGGGVPRATCAIFGSVGVTGRELPEAAL